ncbi:MAG: rubrerythrin [Lachnospiraceae bacterium]|nr:rubrerythrin [Lachnospiraceae bacterium]MDE7435379.1 rubrerythrin [Lachnospiraceae bacterium]
MEKKNEYEVTITTYDKVMASWHRCMQSAKEFECYFHEIEDNRKAKKLFEEYAETEALQASALRDLLLEYQQQA